MECIVAVGKNLGIGVNLDIPWTIPEDLYFFKQTTVNHLVVMGWSTFISMKMKPLSNRMNVVLTTNQPPLHKHDNLFIGNMDECMRFLEHHKIRDKTKKIFIIGGEKIYKLFLPYVKKLHLTEIQHEEKHVFTAYFPKIPERFQLIHNSDLMVCKKYPKQKYRFLTYMDDDTGSTNSFDNEYLRLCNKVLEHGEERNDRTGTGTFSIFGDQMRFDIRKYIPVLTTKRIPWKSCIEELLWFLRGDTDSNILSKKGVNIWKPNSSRKFLDSVNLFHLEEGDCGANYSFQWRHFGHKYTNKNDDYEKKGIDQIEYIENLLKTDKTSRRIFLSAWNPCDIKSTVLPPCHVSAQFYVNNNNELSCHLYQRSCDMFLGVPWNILSYSVLTYILAIRNGYTPGWLYHSTGDTHIYKDHIEQIKKQLSNEVLSTSKLVINEDVKEKKWNEITIDDFDLVGYFPHNKIQANMSA
uniref:DHFR domain-containing protein n=1 Tax=viral metagenome TaxID=1070528 RepID=A0A6C0BRV5_9ZZZZ